MAMVGHGALESPRFEAQGAIASTFTKCLMQRQDHQNAT